jgi:hypothetical protein
VDVAYAEAKPVNKTGYGEPLRAAS